MDTDHSRYTPHEHPADNGAPAESINDTPAGVPENADAVEPKETVDDSTPQLTSEPNEDIHITRHTDRASIIADYISAIFSPLLLPTYCMAVAMWITPLSASPERARFWSSMMILLITGAIPMAMILGLIKSGHVHNLDITRRRERVIPFIATGLCYVAAAIYVHRLNAPSWLSMMFVGGCATALLFAIISTFWKISAHAGGMGTMTGMLVWLAVNHNAEISIMPWISAVILLTGFVGMARVLLGKHTVSQVVAGVICASILTYIAMGINTIFQNPEQIF